MKMTLPTGDNQFLIHIPCRRQAQNYTKSGFIQKPCACCNVATKSA